MRFDLEFSCSRRALVHKKVLHSQLLHESLEGKQAPGS